MTATTEFLTQEKFDELKRELEELRTVRRREVAESLEYAKSLGDLSENAEYHEARELQASIEDRITKLEEIMKSASIISGHGTDAVSVGASVEVDLGKARKTFTIVSSEEVDVGNGKISAHSPLGEALLGKKRGETFEYRTPKGMQPGKVLSIK